MPLVQPKGIYCLYSRQLVGALAALVGGRSCLEVAAGDGTLTGFLRAAGVDARAVDDQSWAHAINYPDDVEPMDAVAALRQYQPRAVICSFPPAASNNAVERLPSFVGARPRPPEAALFMTIRAIRRQVLI